MLNDDLLLEFEPTDRYGSKYIIKGRRLKASWTPELAQDLEAYHSIDAEAELTAFLNDELQNIINNENQ